MGEKSTGNKRTIWSTNQLKGSMPLFHQFNAVSTLWDIWGKINIKEVDNLSYSGQRIN